MRRDNMNTSTNLVPIDDLPETIRASNIVPADDLPERVTPPQITTGEADVAGVARAEGGITQPEDVAEPKGFIRKAGEYIGDVALGAAETLATGATAVIYGTGSIIAYPAMLPFLGEKRAKAINEYVLNRSIYKPTTESAQGLFERLSKPLEYLSAPRKFAEEKLGPGYGEVTDVATGAFLSKLSSLPMSAQKAYRGVRKGLAGRPVKAGTALMSETAKGEPFTSNINKASAIEKEIQKVAGQEFQLTHGQKSNYPASVRGETVAARGTNMGAVEFLKAEAGNQNALRRYMKLTFPEKQNINEVINVLKPKLDRLKAQGKFTQDRVNGLVSDMPDIDLPKVQRAGTNIREALKSKKLKVWDESQKLYEKVDDVPIKNNVNAIVDELNAVAKESFDSGIAPKDIDPQNIINQVMKGLKEKTGRAVDWQGNPVSIVTEELNFARLKGLRSQAFKLAEESKRSGNYMLSKNTRAIGNIIDKGMEAEANSIGGTLWQDFRNAQDFYKNEYVNKYRLGTAGKVLQRGKGRTGYNLTDSEVAKEFFSSDMKRLERMRDLIDSVGIDNAKELTRDYVLYNFKDKVLVDGIVKPVKLQTWLNRHKDVLREVDMLDDFTDIGNAQKIADKAGQVVTEYEKSIAGKLLGVDVQAAIDDVFSSPKRSGLAASELMKELQGNPDAISGLRGAFKDFMVNKIENLGKDIAGQNMLSPAKAEKMMKTYDSAIKVLWRNEPAKIKALHNFRDAVGIITRNAQSQLKGSSTAEWQRAMAVAEKLPLMGFSGVVARFLMKLYDYHSVEKINSLLSYARFNPNEADRLVNIARLFNKTHDAKLFNQAMGVFDISPDTAKSIGIISVGTKQGLNAQENPEGSQSALGLQQ